MAEAMVETDVRRHPIMAVVWGIVGGIGVSLFLIGRAQIAFGQWTAPIIIVLIMIALNLLWTYFGPAKKPKGEPPVRMEHEPSPAVADAGFDGVAAQPEPPDDPAPAPPRRDPDDEGGSGLAPPPGPPGGS